MFSPAFPQIINYTSTMTIIEIQHNLHFLLEENIAVFTMKKGSPQNMVDFKIANV
jgi:hypothetical protein